MSSDHKLMLETHVETHANASVCWQTRSCPLVIRSPMRDVPCPEGRINSQLFKICSALFITVQLFQVMMALLKLMMTLQLLFYVQRFTLKCADRAPHPKMLPSFTTVENYRSIFYSFVLKLPCSNYVHIAQLSLDATMTISHQHSRQGGRKMHSFMSHLQNADTHQMCIESNSGW